MIGFGINNVIALKNAFSASKFRLVLRRNLHFIGAVVVVFIVVHESSMSFHEVWRYVLFKPKSLSTHFHPTELICLEFTFCTFSI